MTIQYRTQVRVQKKQKLNRTRVKMLLNDYYTTLTQILHLKSSAHVLWVSRHPRDPNLTGH